MSRILDSRGMNAKSILRIPRRLARAVLLFRARMLEVAKRKARDFGFLLRNRLLYFKPICVKLGGAQINLQPRGFMAQWLWSGLYFEKQYLEFILSHLKPHMTFFDIGANAGIYALAAAKKIGDGRVYAFEPSSWTFNLLQDNVTLNQLTNVIPFALALGDHVGEATLHVNATNKAALDTIGKPSHRECRAISQETVKVSTLDSIIGIHGIERVDVMRVDVEGAELLVFQGGKNLLQRSDAPLILYEGYSWCTAGFRYHPVEIMWLLQDFGYSLFVFDKQSGKVIPRPPGQNYSAMVVAIKPQHRSFDAIQQEAR